MFELSRTETDYGNAECWLDKIKIECTNENSTQVKTSPGTRVDVETDPEEPKPEQEEASSGTTTNDESNAETTGTRQEGTTSRPTTNRETSPTPIAPTTKQKIYLENILKNVTGLNDTNGNVDVINCFIPLLSGTDSLRLSTCFGFFILFMVLKITFL